MQDREAIRAAKKTALVKGRKTYRKGYVTLKYAFPSLKAYFEFQALLPLNHPKRDTMEKMAERVNVARMTIWNLSNRKSEPSYSLAIAISRDASIALDSFEAKQ